MDKEAREKVHSMSREAAYVLARMLGGDVLFRVWLCIGCQEYIWVAGKYGEVNRPVCPKCQSMKDVTFERLESIE